MMRKNFGIKPWVYPQPVLMIGTYDDSPWGKGGECFQGWSKADMILL